MSLTSANVSYPAHVRMHQHQQSQPYAHPHLLDTSPTMSHESLPSKLGNVSPSHSHPLSPMEPSLHHPHHSQHHHYHPQQHQQPSSYHHSQAPYQAPTPPYNPRSNSIDLAPKPTLPYPRRPSHSYAPSHPYSPPTLPPLTNHLPPSPQSPIDSGSLHYPMQSSNRDDRPLSTYQHYRSSMSSSPPPSSSGAASATSPSATTTASGLPLSATDRRERNKAASAKYRAKKHYQSGEMRQQINVLQDQNNVLTRQLDESRTENASLKHLVEKLRGRLVAEKVLKRLREVGREKKKKTINNNNKRRLNGGKNASSLAHLAAASDSEDDHHHDDEEEDDSDLVGDVDVEYDDEDEDDEDAELQKRQNERKPNTRRRVTRAEDNDGDEDEDDDYLAN
ncbi:hypothetical protein KVV02_006435 [Mortierella alpina]|uniref:BZIP domain-containing protein n=1 Tax=Mortierella alpina TaxID=64518 RepID=A0A9P8A7H9_MORAP|nr:hypothetical protein KVV02_006435 [Mortierella alpina]